MFHISKSMLFIPILTKSNHDSVPKRSNLNLVEPWYPCFENSLLAYGLNGSTRKEERCEARSVHCGGHFPIAQIAALPVAFWLSETEQLSFLFIGSLLSFGGLKGSYSQNVLPFWRGKKKLVLRSFLRSVAHSLNAFPAWAQVGWFKYFTVFE